jgi:hypothetical protein
MILPQFIHKLTSSFHLWADHVLLERGKAFTTLTGQFTNYTDTSIPSSYEVFGCPHKEWVTDSSVDGAVVPSGFFVDGSFQARDGESFILDFINGRVIASGVDSSNSISGVYSVKDFNIYASNQDEESLVVETCENYSNQYNTIGTDISTPYLPPKTQKVPAIFINTQTQVNEPFALGGLDNSKVRVNMTVFAKNPYELDGVLGLFADTSDEIFKEVPLEAAPMNEIGDIKGGYYNYNELVAASGISNISIDSVKTSKVSDSLKRSLKTELYIGFADFELSQPRTPRI